MTDATPGTQAGLGTEAAEHARTKPAEHPMIRLDRLVKRYPGQEQAAVEELSLDIPEGRIVAFVGPSGCGKTTTMKLINRLIEPTSGRIHLDGQDVTELPVHELRRRIGYAIQSSGLFPHRTVADNIATVPRLLGWSRQRVTERVDELLTMVGLDPATYRDRYPKQLSGGQQQRVGVARALGGDPQVMLMDEPFGAIDPQNREALQDEFLRIQRTVRKTIVFVTHDIDEACKMGDLIAVFGENGKVRQYDTPERILAEPADEFVAAFIGSGASVRRLSLTRLGTLDVPEWPTVDADADPERRLAVARAQDREYCLVLDADRRPAGWLPTAEADTEPPSHFPVFSTLGPHSTLFDALDLMLSADTSTVVAVDDEGRYRGVLEMDTVRELINSEQTRTAHARLQEA
ncbi:ABC transporter ATP-binding protein [Streptomyces luteolus]|uniref:ABC transporter ATP-binding protein n=1 Tax=Streptomyces luteolus TaxID=3043615 RepID=A0ABT6SWC6_9ACTN|nr:ABC transporter ATP-binding protein [Streptomyces sp. B-S-A12]MDI3419515.1 ABC transporter ATP-binding protein [Streptomyces sp. B-S-A12]